MARADRQQRSGSLSFCLLSPQHTETDDAITAIATVQNDRTIEIRVEGLFKKLFVFREPLPECRRGLRISLAWSREEIKLHLNGRYARTLHTGDAILEDMEL